MDTELKRRATDMYFSSSYIFAPTFSLRSRIFSRPDTNADNYRVTQCCITGCVRHSWPEAFLSCRFFQSCQTSSPRRSVRRWQRYRSLGIQPRRRPERRSRTLPDTLDPAHGNQKQPTSTVDPVQQIIWMAITTVS